MKNENNAYTLITGASMGLGKEFAKECAKRKMNLILVSLPDENLNGLCDELALAYGIEVYCRETDLTKRDAVEELAKWTLENFSVNMIINNAGVGGSRIFGETSVDYLENIIQLNISAMVFLTRLLLPELKRHPSAYVLNVSSLAAFSPVPFKTVYPASKAFIHHFSRGLKAELQDTSVSVSVLSPGPIMTNSDVSKRINGQSSYIKQCIMPAEKIAQIAIKKLLKGNAVIIPGFLNKLNAFMISLTPIDIRINIGTTIFKRELKKKKLHESTRYGGEQPAWEQPDQETVTERLRS
jgi:hypothetical protein